jgi:ABC-type branched-subunit amino acid transport system ATPase component
MQKLASDKMRMQSNETVAEIKLRNDEANRQVKLVDIQQRAHDAEANRAARIQEKSLDIAHSLAVHPEAQGIV